MRTFLRYLAISWLAVCAVTPMATGTTIDGTNKVAYGSNVGWMNAAGNGTNGAVLGQYACTGYVWSAGCGWLCLGNWPTNGWRYGNDRAGDFGVNLTGQGELVGYAYGANIGWVTFEQAFGCPRVDLRTGILSGYAYGANVGWISLSNAQAYVSTTELSPGPDANGNGLPDSWEMARAGNLTTLLGGSHDQDHDGVTDLDEYKADTDPLAATEAFRMMSINVNWTTNTVAWTVRPTRLYRLQAAPNLESGGAWTNVGFDLQASPGMLILTNIISGETAAMQCYRVQAVIPLSK